MVATYSQPLTSVVDSLPVLDLAAPDITIESNRRLAELRDAGPVCRVPQFDAMHQCLGQLLGRLEARVALEEWFARVSTFAVVGEPTFVTMLGGRGFASLPLAFERRPRPVAAIPAQESGVNTVAVADKIAHKSNAELGLDKRAMSTVKVAWVRSVSPTVKLFKLMHPSGGLLERFTPGSHIIIHMRDGSCETRVVSGTPIYRNSIQTPAERADGTEMMVCIDRAKGPLTLDV